ncbi:hypothetical protein [Aliiroseovarius sp. S253]|uniref:hypothetical protein n=1 Tax=Aliiroseovarius sp. S253 TaxID=3415133 RepID=UPI003C7BBAFE
MKNSIVILLCAGLLAACQSGQGTNSSQTNADLKSVSDPKLLAEMQPGAKDTRTVLKNSPTLPQRTVVVSVRATVKGKSVPARCRLQSPYERIVVSVPTKISLPDYSTKSPEYAVFCQAGDLKGTAVAEPKSVQKREATTVAFLFAGAVGASLASGVKPEEGSKFTYSNINVTLK